ncbi:cytochrome P450 [Mycobacterium camsae]|uniref:cytochrome P450 n=1 Tax=Mycobacterium gordonae TaxID=1778 RepID=UPI00197DF859|nr:cytochrome P450 [Mycobacterium gordonae]
MTDNFATVDEAVPFFPAARVDPFSAPPRYTELRAAGGLHRVTIWDGSQHWLATRYSDVRAALTNPAMSPDVRRAGFPLIYPNQIAMEGGVWFRLDDPEHARLRRMLSHEFSLKHTRTLRKTLLELVDELIDDMLRSGGPADFVQAFAHPLPLRAICAILGVPRADHTLIERNAYALSDLDMTAEQQQRAFDDLVAYNRSLLERRQHHPADDMTSRLVHEHSGDGGHSLNELAVLMFFLIAAGYVSTANMLALGALALLLDDSQRERLREQPELAAGTVEEMLRFWSVISTDPRRIALQDTQLGGQPVRAGEGVIVSLIAANHDPDAFGTDAEHVDITRTSRQHLALGFGSHLCLGQNLARAELEIAWSRLLQRIPDLRLGVAPEDVEFMDHAIAFGVKSLPVDWDGAR